jgi:hypothetical protein
MCEKEKYGTIHCGRSGKNGRSGRLKYHDI